MMVNNYVKKKDKLDNIPIGGIVLWSGTTSSIPKGWFLCDGSNGTPDLKDRFIIGAGGAYNPKAIGGSSTVILTAANIPSHTHTIPSTTTNTESWNHAHTYYRYTGSNTWTIGRPFSTTAQSVWYNPITNSSIFAGSMDSSGSHTHTVSGSVSNTGNGNGHENKPPYYAVYYIMKMEEE